MVIFQFIPVGRRKSVCSSGTTGLGLYTYYILVKGDDGVITFTGKDLKNRHTFFFYLNFNMTWETAVLHYDKQSKMSLLPILLTSSILHTRNKCLHHFPDMH